MSKTMTLQELASQKSEKYQQLEVEAQAAGMSVPDWVHHQWEKTRPRFTQEDLIERLKNRKRIPIDAAALVREGREERDAQIDERLKNVRS